MNAEEQAGDLESPLIPFADQEHNYQARKGQQLTRDEFFVEVKKQLLLVGPLVSSNFLLFCIQVVSVMYVGHLGELALSGASMATSFASVTGISLMIGMGSALDTFCGQSYGAKHYHMLGIHMQRAMIVLLLVSIPLAIVWANTGFILEFLGQDPEISAAAGEFACYMIPSLFAYAILQCHSRFLQTQTNVVPMIVTTGTATLLHLLICWLLVYKTSLGYKGAAVANCIAYWINALLLFLYVRFSPSCKHTWTGFSKEAFHGILSFLKLSIPSAVMISLEMWCFEMMVLLSGLLPNPKLETSVLSISLNTCALTYMIPLGLGGAASTRVSNELGAGKPQLARLAVCVTLSMVVTEGIVVVAVMILGRKVWGYCYTSDKEVVEYVGEILLWVAIAHFFDGIQSVLSGVIRGSGQQKIGAYVNLGAYYLIGIPISIILAFVLHIGGKGLWIGITVALFVQAVSLSIIVTCTNWEKEVKKASDRVHKTMAVTDAVS
ncbi:protein DETOXIFICATION 16-like isoform X1 [Prunus yedoensis var. nudiflora]|uniref:Protein DETOXIFICATION n=1 Tax=Prunus yedoensis var. nudiflora TaxID=2094558 RepID=A0A314UWC2_PRUYE|nr:protein DETOXIFICATION 16-like isoform X1 [Prunus yedoensis var. nudiflora]